MEDAFSSDASDNMIRKELGFVLTNDGLWVHEWWVDYGGLKKVVTYKDPPKQKLLLQKTIVIDTISHIGTDYYGYIYRPGFVLGGLKTPRFNSKRELIKYIRSKYTVLARYKYSGLNLQHKNHETIIAKDAEC